MGNERQHVEFIRQCYPKGTRIELESMSGESQMPLGLQGTVSRVDDAGQIHVNWDNGSTLALIDGEDSFRKLPQEQTASDEQKGIVLKSEIPFIREWQGTAESDGYIDEWRASHYENIRCRDYIDSSETGLSATAFDGFYVDKGGTYFKSLIEQFGYQRTMCVLASSLKYRDDGRIHSYNKVWAQKEIGDMNAVQTREYISHTDVGLLDILAKNVQKAYDSLGLYSHEHCEPNSYAELDYENKVLVRKPECLKEEYWSPENQLFYVNIGGNGTRAGAIGRSFVGTYLADGEECRQLRSEFIGVMKDECIPDWAREKVAELTAPSPEESGGMTMT